MNDEKERLEKELRFLKESLEANIISEEEYEKGKTRIEKRLDELGAKIEEKDEDLTASGIKEFEEEKKEEDTAADILKEVEEEEREEKSSEKIEEEKEDEEDWVTKELKELGEEKLIETKPKTKISEPAKAKLSVKPKEKKEEKEKPKKTEKPEEPKEEKTKQKKPESKEVDFEEEGKPIKINRKTLRIAAIIAIIILIILIRRSPTGVEQTSIQAEEEFKPVCSADEECIETGKAGFCRNPGTEEAVCEFYEPREVELTVIDDKTCVSCDTSRTLNILRQLFPGIRKTTVEANSPEGRSLINGFDVKVLPAYIFSDEIEETMKFDKFKRALIKKGEGYLVTPTASGSNYFFARPSKPATIELFVEVDQDTTIIDNSMKEVIGLFGGKITFDKQIVQKSDKETLKRELAINTFPAYIINNQLKFTGTQASEIIKNRFCYLNNFPECGTTLSVDIVKTQVSDTVD